MPHDSLHTTRTSQAWSARCWAAAIAALSLLTLLIQGYHPLSEDGGLYVAGVQYTLNPRLFPHYTEFVTEHLGYSVFAPVVAALVRGVHLPLDWVLMAAYLWSVALTFVAAHQLLKRCVRDGAAQLAGLALLATWWTLPVAGTSLMLMDPYVTARSISTPLSLLAIAYALDDWRRTRSGWWCLLSLGVAGAFHPLMAGYAAGLVITLRVARLRRSREAFAGLGVAALLLAAVLQARAAAEWPPVVAAAVSRYYWFLSQWQWFELLGLAGPLVILGLLLRFARRNITTEAVTLMRACVFVGLLATTVALLFCHRDGRVHMAARLQPLRIFLPIYAVMTLLLGATLMTSLSRTRERAVSGAARRAMASLPVVACGTLAAVFFFVQRSIYPASPHIELPGLAARNTNPWVQAFVWVRANTPQDALFALDAKYVNQDGEDAQTFRAWSLRAALPDFSKDGGEAAITPSLAPAWMVAAAAQLGLSTEDDGLRDARIVPLGATWMIVRMRTATQHACPYANATVKVCRLTTP